MTFARNFYHVFITATRFRGLGVSFKCDQRTLTLLKTKWRKRVGVEPTNDTERCHPPVLKTGRVTGPRALPHPG
jgi:hypothetical protein